MFFFLLYTTASVLLETSAIDITVATDPSGPPYRAGTLYDVICNASNGIPPYQYEWSLGCSYTNIFSNYIVDEQTIGSYTTTPIKCQNVYKCRATDETGMRKVAQITIDPVTDIAIQILHDQRVVFLPGNISILTVNDSSGEFLDIICNTGLKQPNVGKWILPNGDTLTQSNELLEVQRGGGFNSLPFITLGLKDDQSLGPEDTGLYTCVMPDTNMVEHESHIWILQDQDFEPPEPEYFFSHSGRNLQFHCGYSNTPGEILWFVGSNLQSSNDNFQITQNLLRTSPTVLYEGVLEILNANSIAVNDLIIRCIIFSTIIESYADPFPEYESFATTHYFFPELIGNSPEIVCTFNNPFVYIIEIYSGGKYVKSVYFKQQATIRIDMVKDETHNRKYSCIGIPFIGTTEYVNVSILALIPPHALTMHIMSQEVVVAGESLTLDLSAEKSHGFSFNPSISCINQNNIPLSEIDEFNYPDNSSTIGSILRIQVPIAHVKLSHAGLYLCMAFLETPPLLDNISDTANTAITVKIPPPTVFMDNSTTSPRLQTGGIAVYKCSCIINSTHLDLPVHAIFTWMLGGSIIKTKGRFKVSETNLLTELNSCSYSSMMRIAPVIREADEEILTCNVFITQEGSNEYISDSLPVNESIALQVEGPSQLNSEMIQLKLLGLQEECLGWIFQPYNFTYLMTVSKTVLGVVIEICNCEYSIEYITDEHFQCPGGASTYVIYRARLFSSHIVEAEVLAGYIQNWVMSNPDTFRFNTTNLSLNIDPSCDVIIGSFNDSLCLVPDEPVAVEPTSSVTINSLNLVVQVGIILGSQGLLLLFALALTLFSISCIILYRKRKTSTQSMACTSNNPGEMQLCTFNYGETQLQSSTTLHHSNPAYDHICDRRKTDNNTTSNSNEKEWPQLCTSHSANPAYDHIRNRREFENEATSKGYEQEHSISNCEDCNRVYADIPMESTLPKQYERPVYIEHACEIEENKNCMHVYDYIKNYQFASNKD